MENNHYTDRPPRNYNQVDWKNVYGTNCGAIFYFKDGTNKHLTHKEARASGYITNMEYLDTKFNSAYDVWFSVMSRYVRAKKKVSKKELTLVKERLINKCPRGEGRPSGDITALFRSRCGVVWVGDKTWTGIDRAEYVCIICGNKIKGSFVDYFCKEKKCIQFEKKYISYLKRNNLYWGANIEEWILLQIKKLSKKIGG